MASKGPQGPRGPPRFVSPIAAIKIRKADPPPSIYELQESLTVAAPAEMAETVMGTGVGVSGAPGGLGDVVPVEAAPKVVKPKTVRAPRTAEPAFAEAPTPAATETATPMLDFLEPTPALPTLPSAPSTEATAPKISLAPPPSDSLVSLAARLVEKTDQRQVKVTPDAFMPANRRAFKPFIIEAYRRYKLPAISEILNPNACAEAAAASKTQVKAFAYQQFVRDYIQRPSPYRGVLVYHGLGSGKTCTSIAGLEALWQAGQKPVYVMTPASLSPNYRDEITKCGPFVFRTNNYWTFVAVPSVKAPSAELDFLTKVVGLPLGSIRKRRGGWVPDPARAKKPNFDMLRPEQRREITEQIVDHMDYRIQFIHYNGLLERQVRDWACNHPTMFDGATIIIEEVHNLIRTINNSALEQTYKDEPRDLVQYVPKFCSVGKKYRISYLLYRMLTSAVGCKIIALSATPIINFAQEVAILSNVLAGDIRMVEVNTSGLDKRAQIKKLLDAHPEVDFAEVVPRPEISASTIRITPVPSGCRKVVDPTTGTFRGFIRDEAMAAMTDEVNRERNVEAWFERVKASLATAGITSFAAVTFKSISRLPDTEKQFRELFIDTDKLEVKPRLALPLMARLSGLISYYKGGKADLMATVNRDEIVMLDMSDLQLKKYTEQRKPEIDKEVRARKEKKPGAESVYSQISKNISSTFKIFSRAACNFVFPADYERPIPADYRDVLKMIGAKKPTLVTDDEVLNSENEVTEVEKVAEAAEEDERAEMTSEDAAGTPTAAEETAAAAGVAENAAKALPPATYAEALTAAVAMLRSRAAEYFSPEALPTISPKFQAILDRVVLSKGPVLVYSNFKTLEGVGLFSVALEFQQKYTKFDIVKTPLGDWALSPETIAAGAGAGLRYITYTGDEERDKRNILLAIFNGKWSRVPGTLAAQVKELFGAENNLHGEIIKVIMITQSGAEGISLANVRQVHIMEPYWNYVRLDQVKGRAIRICSHMDLPPDERNVDIFTYVMKFSDRQVKERLVDETITNIDGGDTTDQSIFRLLMSKKHLSDSILDVMKKSAVDCELNSTENGGYACYRFAGNPSSTEPLYHPIVEIDVTVAEASVRSAV